MMQFPGFESIFSLSEPFATRPFRGSLREAAEGLDMHGVASGRVVPTRPVRIVPYGGNRPGDFIWTDHTAVRLVSQRVLDLLRETQVSGWSMFPVEVHDRNGQPLDRFEGLCVTGRCGKLDPGLSTPIQKEMPGGVFPYSRGYFFDPVSWDGSHVFCPEGTHFIWVTDVVRDLLHRCEAKNVTCQPITEIEFGRMEKRLMEERLRQE